MTLTEWKDPNIFFKQLEEQEEMFGQLALNGSLTGGDASMNASNFIANPWAGQESVQVDSTDPWAAFDFGNNDNDKSGVAEGGGTSDDNWAKFDQSFPSSSVNDNCNFADFSSAVDFFEPIANNPMLTTNASPPPTTSAINPATTVTTTTASTEEAKPSQL